MESLKGMKVAILVHDGFEQVELVEPRKALNQAGADTKLISPKEDVVRGWNFREWGDDFPVELQLQQAHASDFDALLLPGGVMNPDKLRIDEAAMSLVKQFLDSGRIVAAICHGPWLLAQANALGGRRATSYKSIRKDIENAGAYWVDEEVVTDNGIITSRSPGDLKAFSAKIIEELGDGIHVPRQAAE